MSNRKSSKPDGETSSPKPPNPVFRIEELEPSPADSQGSSAPAEGEAEPPRPAAGTRWRRMAAGATGGDHLVGATESEVTKSGVKDLGAAAFKLISGRANIRKWITGVMKKGGDQDQDDDGSVPRRFLFENEDRRQPGEGEVLEDFNEVVDVDGARVETFISQELVGHLTNSKTFNFGIFLIIVFNSVLIAMQTSDELTQRYSLIFSVIDQVVLTIFIFEIGIKWFYGFYAFWLGAWNIIDFVVIFILLFGSNMTFFASSRLLRLLRVLRAFRSVRSFSTSLESLSLVVDTILASIPDMANVSLLLLVFMLVVAVIGVTVFGDDFQENFGNLNDALYVCFICVTEDGWVDIFKPMRDSENQNLAVASSLYFVFLVVIGAFVFSNLIVAVVVTNLEIAMKEYAEEMTNDRPLFASYLTGATSSAAIAEEEDVAPEDVVTPIVCVDKLLASEEVASRQRPIQIPRGRAPSPARVANLAAVLVALEESLAEYAAIRGDLSRAAGVLAQLDDFLRRQLPDEQKDPTERMRRASQLLPHGVALPPDAAAAQMMPGDIVGQMEALQAVRSRQSVSGVRGLARRISSAVMGRTGERRAHPLHRMNQY